MSQLTLVERVRNGFRGRVRGREEACFPARLCAKVRLNAGSCKTSAYSRDNRGITQEKLAAEAEARQKAEEEAEEQRKADSKVLAGETIRRELLERM
jgi:hypothetical protein